MLALIYISVSILLGERIAAQFILPKERKGVSQGWVMLGAAYACGTLFLTWATYLAAWFFHVILKRDDCLLLANLLTLFLSLVLIVISYLRDKKRGTLRRLFEKKPPLWECLYLLLLFAFFLFIFFYVFHVKGGVMYAGFSVFSDYGPHTAMIRSFSMSNNYPTQYPHFGGEDVRYHFMFQFLVGNLEYLGMRLDLAYNLASALSITSFFMVCLGITQSLGFGPLGSILPFPLFLFRSGTAFFRFAYEHLRSGDLWEEIQNNTQFLGYTQNENWGFWNLNVYLNQRHLCFGLCIIAIAIYFFLDYVRVPEEGVKKNPVAALFFSKGAWKSRDLGSALIIGLLIGLTSFWNGAAVIGGLLILAGMAFFSEGKLDYLIIAVISVLFAVLQSRLFIFGNAVEPAIWVGFLAEDKSFIGILLYLVQITGLGILGLIFVLQRLPIRGRRLFVCFLLPCVFAFLFSLTPDIGVNHKYIMICYAFCTLLWGGALEKLFSEGVSAYGAVLLLTIALTLTGLYDFVVIIKDNDARHRVRYPVHGEVTEWFRREVNEKDLVLTPLYSISEVTLGGAMLYNGWPYYAWSAGYDTYSRGETQNEIYTTEYPEDVVDLCQEEGITYIVYENGMDLDGLPCHEETIAKACGAPVLDKGYIRVYKVPEGEYQEEDEEDEEDEEEDEGSFTSR